MRRSTVRRRALVALMLVLFSTLVTAIPAGATARDRLNETRRRLRAARARLYEAKRTDAQLLATISEVAGQLSAVRSRLNLYRSRLATIEAKMAASKRRLAKIEARRGLLSADLGERARELYIMGPSGAQAWLGADTMADFLGRSTNMEYVMRFDKVKAEQFARLRHEEITLRKSLARQRARAAEVTADVAEQAELVSDVLSTHEEAEAALADRVRAFQREVAALQAEQNRIVALILARSSVYTGGGISRSGFAWPIRGSITSPYGPRWGGFHTGIDIDCRTGDRIGASKAGRVIAAEWGGGYGNMVIIDHGNGVTTLYAHNSRLYVREGQRVTQRQVISACGSTGNSTGDHLHFEVRINGQHQNPMRFLP